MGKILLHCYYQIKLSVWRSQSFYSGTCIVWINTRLFFFYKFNSQHHRSIYGSNSHQSYQSLRKTEYCSLLVDSRNHGWIIHSRIDLCDDFQTCNKRCQYKNSSSDHLHLERQSKQCRSQGQQQHWPRVHRGQTV